MSWLEELMPLSWWAIAGCFLLIIILSILLIVLWRRTKKFEKAYLALQTYVSGKTLDQLLDQYLNKVETLDKQIVQDQAQLQKIEERLRVAVDQVELIRFSAFDKGGGDLSFAVAMLNQEGDGVVLTSIQTREDCRLYGKPIEKGQSKYSLTSEEVEVIKKAQKRI